MHRSSLLLWLTLGAFVQFVVAAGDDWCYNGCEHTPSHWGDIPGSVCGGSRQSPIDIVTAKVQTDQTLGNFTFMNFTSQSAIESMLNTGHTVQFTLANNEVEVSGGGLNGTYSTKQFHLHWGATQHHPGSEHKIDGHQYPMEMHIVSLKKGLNSMQAKEDPTGIAVLGFFINGTDDEGALEPWKKLTDYLNSTIDAVSNLTHDISIDELIGNVDRTKFYRYMGSLTTPSCNEAVVWTVFHEPISIYSGLIEMFPKETGLTNVFRPTQPLHHRRVSASPATPLPPSHSWCYDDHCEHSPSHWHLLPGSYCDGKIQSPIDIEKKKAEVDDHLDSFNFIKFEDKHAIGYVVNTGHTVKFKVKEGVEVSGGGLGHVYSTLQFHFHWGNNSDNSVGSEHMVDSHGYPMEMHIVNKRKDLELSDAVKTSNGLAVLAFFMEPTESTKERSGGGGGGGGSEHPSTNPVSSSTNDMDPWQHVTNQLSSIQITNAEIEFTEEISISDLIGGVNRDAYYRYNGSLTTPSCNEAVVWTVFKEPIKVDKDLMSKFPTMAGYHNVRRSTQLLQSRKVLSTRAASSTPRPIALLLLLTLFCSPLFIW